MKITLSELRQLVKSVIRENLQMETSNPVGLDAAKSALEEIGFRVFPTSNVGDPSIKMVKDKTTVIIADKMKSAGTFTIQVNNESPIAFGSVNDSKFKLVVSRLDAGINP